MLEKCLIYNFTALKSNTSLLCDSFSHNNFVNFKFYRNNIKNLVFSNKCVVMRLIIKRILVLAKKVLSTKFSTLYCHFEYNLTILITECSYTIIDNNTEIELIIHE